MHAQTENLCILTSFTGFFIIFHTYYGIFCDFSALFLAQNFKTKILTAQKNLLLECLVTAVISDLDPNDSEIAQATLQNNAFWAHGENITVSMLGDDGEEVKRQAVLWIKSAREQFSAEDHPR